MEYPSLDSVRRHCTELRWSGRYIIAATLDDPPRHALRELVEHPAGAMLRELTLRNVSERSLAYVVQLLIVRPEWFAHLRTLAVHGPAARSSDPALADRLPNLCWIAVS